MPTPHASSRPVTPGLSGSPAGESPSPSLTACTPAAGPRRRPVTTVPVDDELVWVTVVPALELAAARAPSPAALVHLSVRLVQDLADASGATLEVAVAEAELIDAAARAVAGYLEDLPDLPFVGEPFGGEEGTD